MIVSVIGNVGADPELRYTPGGQPVCTLSVAESRKYTDGQGNEQEQTTWWRVVSWKEMAENIADSISKGDRVMVTGRCEIRSFKDTDGNDKWVTEITAYDVAPSLRWATAKVEKNEKKSGGAGRAPAPPDFDSEPF